MPPAATNKNPVVASATATPFFGVVGLSQLTLAASATDPDGDAVTYQWAVGTATLNGANQTVAFSGDGPQTATLTVSDGKGGTATATAPFAAGTMNGTWAYTFAKCGTAAAILTATTSQSGGTFTGSAVLPVAQCTAPAGTTLKTDPAGPGTINAAGAITMRLKVDGAADIIITANMDTTGATPGRRITGVASSLDNAYSNEPFTMIKQ
jgi:hypothetical protein